MQKQTGFALRPAIAALTLAASSIALAPVSNAAPEDAACLRGPKGVAPQGKHWYYRTERPAMRKCWYLAEKGRAVVQRATARPAPPQGDDEEESDAPATVATAPAARASTVAPEPVAKPAPAPVATAAPPPAAEPPAAPVITTLTTRNVSNPSEIAQAAAALDSTPPPPLPNTASDTARSADAASVPPTQAPRDEPAPASVAERLAAVPAAPEPAIASSETMSTLQLLLGAIALLGFLASGLFLVMALLRRRSDVLSMRREEDALPFEPSPEMGAQEEGPRFEPLRALDPIRQRDLDPMRQHDDVDEILQRLARRRRAA